ncbi:MAG: glycoside hydrolase family 13 protein, partial [Clostridia bacterium]|nr:glycoside hydrolase family 13 protein [Clostridia bacterium]
HIRFRSAKHDLDKVTLVHGDKYEWHKKQSVTMELLCSDELYDYFGAEVKTEHKRLAYIFELIKGEEKLCFTQWGALKSFDEQEIYKHFFQYPYLHQADMHVVPQWAKEAVFYQIFPERFYDGDCEINPDDISTWGDKPTPNSHFGGDLQGIIEKIDYLVSLGITAIYLTPIFESPSNHKYDTTDYFKIDPSFGDLDTLKELVSKCHRRGIKVVLDAVFNHCGYDFAPFRDVIKKGSESPYYDWFHIYKWPFEENSKCYDMFAFVERMPKLNTANPEVAEYLLKVARYWIEEADIDGWRLDVSDEVDHEFWRAFRKAVKNVKTDAYIVGENWLDSSPWLMGEQFDSVMNYPITKCCIQYFAENSISEEQFENYVSTVQMNHTEQVNEVMFNLLDSHDTPRFLTLAGGNKNSLKLASAFVFTYIGVPCIYYGTEIGMEGGGDPDCRRTMEWNEDKWDKELLGYYKSLVDIRKSSEALKRGSFRWIAAEDGLIAFERKTDHERVIVVINNHEREASFAFDIGNHRVVDMAANEEIHLSSGEHSIKLEKYSARILRLE